jgi:hypothetical protein
MHVVKNSIIVFFIITIFTSCKPNLTVPAASAGNADFSRTIIIGGDFTAGFMDGALSPYGQTNSIGNLIGADIQNYLHGWTFNQPLIIGDSGIGPNPIGTHPPFFTKLILENYKGPFDSTYSLFPVNLPLEFNDPIVQQNLAHLPSGQTYQNLSVPLATSFQLTDPNLGKPLTAGGSNPYYPRFASDPGVSTVIGDATSQNPTFFILNVGMEDLYLQIMNGSTANLQSTISAFSAQLELLIDSLTKNGAKGCLATIPDFSDFAYFNTVPFNALVLDTNFAAELNGLTANKYDFKVDSNGFRIKTKVGDTNRLLRRGERVMMNVPIDSLQNPNIGMGSLYALPNRYYIDATDIANIEAAIPAINQVIENAAQAHGLAVADVGNFLQSIRNGYETNGQLLNSNFVTGGFFSLDGYHPTALGYALLANEYIAAINAKYNCTIPLLVTTNFKGVLLP